MATETAAEAPPGNGGANPVHDIFSPDKESVDAVLLAALTNSEFGNTLTTESAQVNHDFSVQMPMPSIEYGLDNSQPPNTKGDAPVEPNTNNNHDTADMPMLTSPFEPNPTISALKDHSNDPVLFSIDDWEELSPAAEPSSTIVTSNTMTTLASPLQPIVEPVVQAVHQPQPMPNIRHPREPSMVPQSHHPFPIAMNPHLVDLRTGRRRSQSVPPPSEMRFQRNLATGRKCDIGEPKAPPSVQHSLVQNHYFSAPAPFTPTRGRPPQQPCYIAHPPMHSQPLGMTTEPASPAAAAPHALHPPTSLAPHPRGGYSLKRGFQPHDEHDGERGRKPEPKRRVRKKTQSPSGAGGGLGTDLWSVESIVENLKVLIGQRLDEVRGGAMGDVELLRSQHRDHNRLVVDLDAPLSVLDVEFRPEEVCGAPATGRVIMRLDHSAMNRLLQVYDVPYIVNMFLFEKKLLYLRFVGANKTLMHKVLD